jgi:hypothetical protein
MDKMPRYFFHFYADGHLMSRDSDFPDLASALEACARIIRERSRNLAPDAVPREIHSAGPMLRMADEFGRTIINVPIASFPDDADDARD